VIDLVVMPLYAELVVIAIGVLDVIVSIYLQRKVFIDEEKMYRSQMKMKKFQSDMKEMVKNKASQEELMNKQKEMMPLMSENMSFSIKSAIPSLILFFAIYDLILPYIYKAIAPNYIDATVYFIMPLNYHTLFWATILILGIVGAIYMAIRDRKNIKKLAEKVEKEI